MADRGRDFKVNILSDAEKFDLTGPADDMERLGREAKTAGEGIERLDREVKDGEQGLDRLGREAKSTAEKVDSAFDKIARSSRSNLRKVDDDVDRAKKGMDDFKGEAGESGREAAASFSGEFSDIGDTVQEIAAQAFAGFGPLGAAAGIAAAAGIGIITKVFNDSKDRAEESKERVKEFFDAFVEGQGRLAESAITSRLEDMLGDPERYKELKTDADEAHISIELLARARAGDLKATELVSEAVRRHTESLDANKHITTDSESAQLRQRNALDRVSEGLGITTGEVNEANSAWGVLKRATAAPIVAKVNVNAPSRRALMTKHEEMQVALAQTITVPVRLSDTTRAAQLAWLDADRYFRNNPITIRTTGPTGRRPVRDVP